MSAFKIKNNRTILELVRYGFAGLTTTVVNILIYHFFLFINIDYRWSNLIALIGSKGYGYVINKIFVFKSHCSNTKELLVEIGNFIIARGFTGLVDYFGLIIMVEIFNFDKIISKYLIQIMVIILNFVFGKYFVFRKTLNKKDKVSNEV